MNGFEIRQNIKIREYLNRSKPQQSSPLPLDVLLKKNQHTLVVMTPIEFWDFLIKYYKKKGLNEEDIMLLVIEKLVVKGHRAAIKIQQEWQDNRGNIKTASGFLPNLIDSKALAILAYDMKRGGNLWSQYRIQNYAGSSYVILKGNPVLRQHLTGTRYLASNPKVVSMGLGKAGASNAIRSGGIVTVIFSAMFHGMDQLMNDKLTWHHFVGGLAADVVVAATAAGASWVAAGVGALTGFAVGPLLAVVFVGGFTAWYLSSKYGDRLQELFTSSLKAMEKHQKILKATGKAFINYGKVMLTQSLEKALHQLNGNIAKITHQAQFNIQQANSDPSAFLHRLFNVPNTREMFK